jgi:hypothetical protein
VERTVTGVAAIRGEEVGEGAASSRRGGGDGEERRGRSGGDGAVGLGREVYINHGAGAARAEERARRPGPGAAAPHTLAPRPAPHDPVREGTVASHSRADETAPTCVCPRACGQLASQSQSQLAASGSVQRQGGVRGDSRWWPLVWSGTFGGAWRQAEIGPALVIAVRIPFFE